MQTIPIENLSVTLIPVGLVLLILLRWKLNVAHSSYAIVRMLAQLLLVGYVLSAIFSSHSAWVTLGVLLVMILFSSWIALGTVKSKRFKLFARALFAIAFGGGLTFWIVVDPVLNLNPWYQARYAIPLAGMIFANTMTNISLAAERFYAEKQNGLSYVEARNQAFNTALIPTINALLAVGLVSLPGMMTGQILSGVSPFIAARYQIMVMMMIFSSAGLSIACFLALLRY
jgi:putative ABC transport system permease protein